MTYVILTVGTGTAGRHSNLAAGLVRTLELLKSSAYWLIPSTSPESLALADLVRDAQHGFQPWSEQEPYRAIASPDSLEECRRCVREVIAQVRHHVRRADRLLVNPTSGTKQMSAGATLAALDEGIGEIVFTIGERADGVVITGTEKIETFNAAGYFAEHDFRSALILSKAGAHAAAAKLLEHHPSFANHVHTLLCLHEWERQNYEAARQHACKVMFSGWSPIRNLLSDLAKRAQSGHPDPIILSDLLANAQILQRRGENEAALIQTCKALEMGLRLRFFIKTNLAPPYSLDALRDLPLTPALVSLLRHNSRDGRTCILGLTLVVEILAQLNDPIAFAYRRDNRLASLVSARNELAHSLRSISSADSQSFLQRVCNLLTSHIDLPDSPTRPVLPRIAP